MHDQFPFPSCFSPASAADHSPAMGAAAKSGSSAVMSVYRTKIAGHCRLITVAWSRNLLAHGLSVSVDEGSESGSGGGGGGVTCKVEVRPWCFWRKQGFKRFFVEGEAVGVFWDLRGANFSAGDPEPQSGYYVAVVSGEEVVLLLGDRREGALRRTASRASAIDATLVSKKEHVFGKRRFSTRARLGEESGGGWHSISIECSGGGSEPEMWIRIDGDLGIHVKHLQWKFRGNGTVTVGKSRRRVEVYWDAHDWLFGPGVRHALFIFKPAAPLQAFHPSSDAEVSDGREGRRTETSDFRLFLYAWKVE